MRFGFQLTLAVTVLLWGQLPAGACDATVLTSTDDDRIEIGADCSFVNGGIYDTLDGAEAIDIGGSRVAQKFTDGGGCSRYELLLFVDCESLETIVIQGLQVETNISGMTFRDIESLQRPIGPISLSSTTTVAEVARISAENGYAFTLDILAQARGEKRRNRYNPLCGCKLFYPDSAGAQN